MFRINISLILISLCVIPCGGIGRLVLVDMHILVGRIWTFSNLHGLVIPYFQAPQKNSGLGV